MKRFEKSVEDMLIGKYGIGWNTMLRSYCWKYCTHQMRVIVLKTLQETYMVQPLMLFGILAYENYLRVKPCRKYHDRNCNAYTHKFCKYNGEKFLEAGLGVIDETKKMNGNLFQESEG